MVYSHVQFRLRMNEIFKSKDCLIQSQNGTKGSLKHLVPHWPWDGSSLGSPTVATVGLPTDATAGSKGCILSLGSNLLVPPGALYIALQILN